MQVRKLDMGRRQDVEQFIALPFALYRDNKQWVPPLLSDMRLMLNRKKNPYFRHSDADLFVVEQGKETLARVAVLHNTNYCAYHKRQAAFFYYWDTVDEAAATRLLFDAAFDWARGRGLKEVIGPLGFMEGDGMGVLVEGFEHRPAMGIPYNYAYYEPLLTGIGFQKATDFSSGYLPGDMELPQRFYDVAEKVKERRGLRIKSFTSAKELRDWAPRIGEVYNAAFVDNWEYFPMPEADIKVVAERLVQATDPRLIKLVMKQEQITGFVFGFTDLSAAFQKSKGRLWPIGWWYILREFKRTKWANFNGLGLLPGHQGVGANAILYTELAKSVREFHFEHAETVQVEEQNLKSLAEQDALGVRWYKKHRIYRREL